MPEPKGVFILMLSEPLALERTELPPMPEQAISAQEKANLEFWFTSDIGMRSLPDGVEVRVHINYTRNFLPIEKAIFEESDDE